MPVSVKIGERSYVHDVIIQVDPNTLKDAPLAPAEKAEVEKAIEEGRMIEIMKRLPHTEDILYQIPDVEIDGAANEEDELMNQKEDKPCKCFKIAVNKRVDVAALIAEIEAATGYKLHASMEGDAVDGYVNTIVTKEGVSLVEVHCYGFAELPNGEHKTTFVNKQLVTPFDKAALKACLQAHALK